MRTNSLKSWLRPIELLLLASISLRRFLRTIVSLLGEVVNEIGRLCGDSRAVTIERADEIATYVVEQSKSGDVILVMSNGGFDKVQDKILNLLKEGRLT